MTAVVYREPGLLAKAVTTLDVLSGGRAWLESGRRGTSPRRAGSAYVPPTAERFERLEEALQICLQMWSDDDKPYPGTHTSSERTLNSPQCSARPHPPILIGGAGERKTLRLVAQYAQACNLFPDPSWSTSSTSCAATATPGPRLRQIEKTVIGPLDPGPKGEHVGDLIDSMRQLAGLGFTHYHGSVPNPPRSRPSSCSAKGDPRRGGLLIGRGGADRPPPVCGMIMTFRARSRATPQPVPGPAPDGQLAGLGLTTWTSTPLDWITAAARQMTCSRRCR